MSVSETPSTGEPNGEFGPLSHGEDVPRRDCSLGIHREGHDHGEACVFTDADLAALPPARVTDWTLVAEDVPPDIPRMCKALDLCGAMFGLWFATMIATLFLLRTPWHLIPWLGMSLLGTLVIRFIGDTLSAELARHLGRNETVHNGGTTTPSTSKEGPEG